MKKLLLLSLLILFLFPLMARAAEKGGTPTPEEILKRIDKNLYSDSRYAESRMVIINRRGRKRVLSMKSWMVGDQKSFSHYTAPAKEKGTKMLKVGKNLWTWSPSTERIIHIAGHLLRQSVMGSDLSYEDALEEVKLSEAYTSTIMKEETVRERKVWLLQLTAKIPDLAYVERRLWVDQEWFVPMREELYGKSGRLLKTINIMETKFLDNRWYPVKILFKDELKSGNGTEFITDVVDFNPDIPENLFSKQSLRK